MPRYRQVAALHTATPTRAPAALADVGVPLMRAIISGLFVGSTMTAIAFAVLRLPVWPWREWLAVVMLSATVAWLRDSAWAQSTIWRHEQTTGQDLDGDGEVGKPDVRLLPINPRAGQAAQARQAEREYREAFARFIHGCESDSSLRRWEREIGREQYETWRDTLIASGYAAWANERDHRAGWRLTLDAGLVVAGLFSPALPDDGEGLR